MNVEVGSTGPPIAGLPIGPVARVAAGIIAKKTNVATDKRPFGFSYEQGERAFFDGLDRLKKELDEQGTAFANAGILVSMPPMWKRDP